MTTARIFCIISDQLLVMVMDSSRKEDLKGAPSEELVRTPNPSISHLPVQVKSPRRTSTGEFEGKKSEEDIYPSGPHENHMWKVTPALSLHFLRVLFVHVFVCMTVESSACLSSQFVWLC